VIHNLHALRAFAAFIVVFVHMDLFAGPLGIPQQALHAGNAGVDIFFVLSGFLMVHTTQLRPISGTQFAISRAVRVVPLYWLITLTVFGIALTLPGMLGATRPDLVGLAKSLAFIPFQKSNGLVMPVLFVGWTLNYEMAFYMIFAVMLGLTGSRVRRTTLLAVSAIILLVLSGLVLRPAALELRFFTNSIMLEFAMGMLIALAVARWDIAPMRVAAPLFGLSLMALLLSAVFLEGWPRALVSGVPAACLVLGAIWLERSGRQVRNAHVALLGDASYALYLTHPFALQGLGKLLPGDASPLLAGATLVCAIVLAQVVAIAVHRGIERPVTRRLHDAVKRSAAGTKEPSQSAAELSQS